MRRGSVAALFAALCVLVALRGGVDVDKQTFVISMGIDKAEDGIAVTIVLPSAQAGKGAGESQGGETGTYELVQATAATFEDALLVLRTTVPRYINFSQLLQIVVCEDLARSESFASLLESVLSTPRLKQSAVLAVSRCKASDFLQKQKPFLGIRLSANIETSFAVYAELGNVPVTTLGHARRTMLDAWSTPLLPLVSLNETQSDTPAKESNPLGTLAGNLPYKGNDPTEYLGAAVIVQGRMVGTLTGAQMELVSFLLGDVDEITYSRGELFCLLGRRNAISLGTRQENGQWTLRVEGQILLRNALNDAVDEAQLRELLFQDILNLLAHLRDLGADPLGFSGRAASRFPTLQAWHQQGWDSGYRDAILEVSLRIFASEAT